MKFSSTVRTRWTVRGLALLAVAAMSSVGFVTAGGASAATQRPVAAAARATVGVHYAVDTPLCGPAKPGYATCFAIAHHAATKDTPGAQPYTVSASYAIGPSGGLTPSDLSSAYGYSRASGGAGQTVAIVDAYDDPNALSDLDYFDQQYGFPQETSTSFVKAKVPDVDTGALPKHDTTGWSGEESLDLDTVRSVCQQCKIILVETADSSDANLSSGVATAVQMGATEVSNSYGGPEGKRKLSKSFLKAYQKAYTYKGVVITASTGDDGWFTYDHAPYVAKAPGYIKSAESPNLPSSVPSVVSVGGTKLNLNSNGTRKSETVWNENGVAGTLEYKLKQYGGLYGLGATGGGCSKSYSAAGWQANIAGYGKTGCAGARLAADVSADGDPDSGLDIFDSYACKHCNISSSGWQTVGGTSLSSPLIASMWALAGGAGDVKEPVLSLYGNANTKPYTRYDVTSGGNAWCDGAAAKTCEKLTAERPFGKEKNPNHLIYTYKSHHKTHHAALGTLDCGFKHKKKAVATTHRTQCYAAKGFDGPSGLGTPAGLGIFKPLFPSETINNPGQVTQGTPQTFTAKASDPFPGGVISYLWNFGQGVTSTKASPTHTFGSTGTKTVTLTVTDNYGQSTTKSISVNVVGPA